MVLENIIHTPDNDEILFLGAPLSAGSQPAIIYFALSAEMTLLHEPFNQPATYWSKQGFRVFSWNLPFHGRDLDPHLAMEKWIQEYGRNPSFFSAFVDKSISFLHFLISKNWINQEKLAVAGLSRGGFIAAHLAACEPLFRYILGFSPLTELRLLQESTMIQSNLSSINLRQIVKKLTTQHLRFYIGNHDTRVHTDACYSFIKQLTATSISEGIRSPQAELILYPSIGHKGHGTPPEIFKDGANWLKNQFLK